MGSSRPDGACQQDDGDGHHDGHDYVGGLQHRPLLRFGVEVADEPGGGLESLVLLALWGMAIGPRIHYARI